MPEAKDFSEYHRKAFNWYKWLGISSVKIVDTSNHSKMKRLLYFVFWGNSVVKVVFLVFLLLGVFGKVNFLDKISSLDYFLCGVLICMAAIIWNDPLIEVTCQIWKVQNKIFKRLGFPVGMKEEVETKHRQTIRFNLVIVSFGLASLGIQFYSDPKYTSFTYSLLNEDGTFLRLIFCAHEVIFMGHAWFCNAGTNTIVTFIANSLSVVIQRMSVTLRKLEERKRAAENHLTATTIRQQYTTGLPKKNSNLPPVRYMSPFETKSNLNPFNLRKSRDIKNKEVYDFENLLSDVRKLSLATRIFNDYVAYKLAGLISAGYCQYIASTCMAFQVMRSQGGSFSGIWFYLQDCIVSCYQNFRVFNNMADVLPLTEELFALIKRYEAIHMISKYQRLRNRTVNKISMNIGSVRLKKIVVLHCMQALMSYYLCVALW